MISKYLSVTVFSLLFLISQNISAQKALDFTMTDTKGKEWNLYDELDNGKRVVLDFFFADCTPCQRLTPAMVKIYESYQMSPDSVLVLGISDRDLNVRLDEFEAKYSVSYPSGGVEGGCDTITDLYKSYFTFPSWPLYAVICPDKSITWNVERDTSLSKVSSRLDSCDVSVGADRVNNLFFNLYPNPVNNSLYIALSDWGEYKLWIHSLDGKEVLYSKFTNKTKTINVNKLHNGIYTVYIENKNQVSIRKFYKN